ncbi:MAG: VWA domain-containing protein [Acidobacteria bacterium]|nr:VWA domain-containing protein [Acidobacteriota bacterium]
MIDHAEALRRWRRILGGGPAEGTGCPLAGMDLGMDHTLEALYDSPRQVGLSPSSPNIARWLGDIREYFPSSVVRVMQADALEGLKLNQMLLEPEMLAAVEPDVNLIATLLSLGRVLPNKTKDTARRVVRRVVDEMTRKLAEPTRQAVQGALNRSMRNRRPRHNEIDWDRTIRANLRHYLPEHRTIIPETRIGYGRRRASLKDVILCLDQSGSMGCAAGMIVDTLDRRDCRHFSGAGTSLI